MKILNSVGVCVLLATVLAACSHSDSGQDASDSQATNQAAKASELAQTTASAGMSQVAASSIQPTTTISKTVSQQTASSSRASEVEQVAAPAVASTIVPVAPTSAAPTGPDRTQAMATTGCNQRSCQ